jgi:hypothetical protein
MSIFKEKKDKEIERQRQQRNIQENLNLRKPPISIKQQRRETVAEAIGSNYKENLKSLLQTQELINKLFVEHPIYQEYHKNKEIAELYEKLQSQHLKTIQDINKLYKLADTQYSDWLKVSSRLENRSLVLTWKDKIKLWIKLKIK